MDADDIHGVLDRASDLLHAGKPAETLRCLAELEAARLDDDERVEFTSLRAWALSELGRTEEALTTVDTVLADRPECARLYSIRGVVLSNADDLMAARRALEQAVELDEEDEVALANLALVYERQRDYERAIELYDRASALGADMDWVLQRKAAAQSEAGDHAGAKTSLRRYLSLVPEDATGWITLAILYSDDDEYPQADECYRAAERIEPRSPALRLNWGVTAVRAGELKRARQQLRHLDRVASNTARAHLLRAFIAEEEGQLEVAQRSYEDALARVAAGDPEEYSYALEMAMDFYARRGERQRCEQLFAQAYAANACQAVLCAAYREATGAQVESATWFSLVIEANCRPGLLIQPRPRRAPARYRRTIDVIARDRDEACTLVMDLMRRMKERRVRLCGFLAEEDAESGRIGIYEIESGCTAVPRKTRDE